MRGVISGHWLISGGLAVAILFGLFLFPSPILVAPGAFIAQARPYEPPSPDTLESNPGDLQPEAYLPVILNCYTPPAGIYGHITKAGLPAGGITVKLILRNQTGDHDNNITSTTNSCGYFSFIDIPSISEGSGQGYFVEFYNYSNLPDSLLQWRTQIIQSYTTNQVFNIGNFDIGDVILGEPNSGTPQLLPVTFYWTRRNKTPSDSYIFYIYEYIYGEENPYILHYYTDPLGFVNSYQLLKSELPAEMVSGKQYYWYLTIFGPDGSTGRASSMHGVAFQLP